MICDEVVAQLSELIACHPPFVIRPSSFVLEPMEQ